VNRKDVIQAWGRISAGYKPLLSIEITRECPLRCPGCYAYEDAHLGGGVTLRQLADKKGDELIAGVLRLVEKHRPLHLSIVGGDPMVRYRELEVLLPELQRRGVYTQLVTSAFRPMPLTWSLLPRLKIVVSIDGLAPEHDQRRKPATYERILYNIAGHRITIHCTITAQMLCRPTYLQEFIEFWTPRKEITAVWFSLFTPQKGARDPEILQPRQRVSVVGELARLAKLHSKLDMSDETIREFLHPPNSPQECVFAGVTETISADLKTRITPCQFGGNPDCSQCGCLASLAMAGVAHKRFHGLPVGAVFRLSNALGRAVARWRPILRKAYADPV
jgi:MoaA/NifB/PqqE/SkfB family radical SAM enzyme